MSKETKIVHFTIIDGNNEDIQSLGEQLQKVKNKLPFEMEFLITNDRIQLNSVDYLLKELIILYKRKKKLMKK